MDIDYVHCKGMKASDHGSTRARDEGGLGSIHLDASERTSERRSHIARPADNTPIYLAFTTDELFLVLGRHRHHECQ
jgi:hypothetical protein